MKMSKSDQQLETLLPPVINTDERSRALELASYLLPEAQVARLN